MSGGAFCTAGCPVECCPGTSADVEVSEIVMSLLEPGSKAVPQLCHQGINP